MFIHTFLSESIGISAPDQCIVIYGIPERKKLLSKDPEILYPGMEIAGTATFAMQGKEIHGF